MPGWKEAPGRILCFCCARPRSLSRKHKIKCCCEADFTSPCFLEDVGRKHQAFGPDVQAVDINMAIAFLY
ncbi:hypothetical protein Salpa_0432 [Sporomusa sp. KB1]|nr:hypothetical protein Salpa_0432 [Sporomusa sp. KB1]